MRKPRNRNPSRPDHGKINKRIVSRSRQDRPTLLQRLRSLSLIWKIALGALTIFGGYVGWLSIRPRVDITIADNAFRGGTPDFTISNNGVVLAYDVTWDCDGRLRLYLGTSQSRDPADFQWAPRTENPAYGDIGTLNGWGSTVRRCREFRMPPGASLTTGTIIVAVVTYRIPLWPFEQHETAIITLEGDQDSGGYWVHQGEALDPVQANELRARGYEVEDLSQTPNSFK